MRSHSTTGPLCSKTRPAWPLRARRAVAALALLASAAVHAQGLPSQPVNVGFANANLMGPISALTMAFPTNCGPPPLTPCAAITAANPLIPGGTAQNNYTALTFVTNSNTGTLDVVYGDAAKNTIWLSKGPGYTNPTPISGPPCPSGMASDPSGNVIVISRSCPQGQPGVWILPINPSAPSGYGPPQLIDNTFIDPNTGLAVNTHALAEVVVAGTAGPLWGVGDVLVLVSPVTKNDDRSGLRVIVYSQAAVKNVLASQSALHGPTSNLVTLAQFTTQSVGKVAPVAEGMDIGTDPNGHVHLYFSTADGRIIDFDSSLKTPAFTTPYVINQGTLGRLRTFTWGGNQYVIVAQQTPGAAGQIRQFDGSSQTKPFASVITGVDNPSGLAVTYSNSTLASNCINDPKGIGCPIVPQVAFNITGSGTGSLASNAGNASIVANGCTFPDPRVTTNPVWSCGTDALGNNTLDLGAHCPNMPHVLLSPKTCGKSGPAGNGISAVRTTPGGTVEQNFNNTLVALNVNPDVVLPAAPGGSNPNCGDPNGPIVLWGPDPGNPSESGVPEGNTLIDTTNHCIPDPPPGGGGPHLSIVVTGAVINSGYTAADIDGHFLNLQTAFTQLIATTGPFAPPQIVGTGVAAAIQNYITTSQGYFDAKNYSCAMNTLWNGAQYVHNLPPTDSIAGVPPQDQNPSGTLLTRFDLLYYQVNVFGNVSPQLTMTDALSTPQGSVPQCATLSGFTVVNATTGATPSFSGGHFLLPETTSFSVVWTTTGETQCTLTTTDGLFNNANEPANSVFGSSPVSFIVAPEGAGGEAGEGHVQTAMLTCGALQASFQYIMQEARSE